jgi:glycosyltransferase involved in cell wall biosynthesis
MSDDLGQKRQGRQPLVSIGIPVFNGENYLVDAIESVLKQTVTDLEVVISDNASTDGTESICRHYASVDPRVVYWRQEHNLGAAPNYNRTFELARGRYFKWLAHDDRMEPTYLARTIECLEADPGAVLCNTVIDFIDMQGSKIAVYDSVLAEAEGRGPAERFELFVLRSHTCADVFGVTRRSALEGTLLHASFHGADRALLAQLALRGRLIQIREHLNQMREHPARYTRRVATAKQRLAWHDATRAGGINLPTLRLYNEYLRMVRRAELTSSERRRCIGVLTRWWLVNWNAVRVAVDAVAIVVPGIVGLAERTKNALFGPPPGHFHKEGRMVPPPRPLVDQQKPSAAGEATLPAHLARANRAAK